MKIMVFIKNILKGVLPQLARFVVNSPILKALLLRILGHFPSLKHRLKHMYLTLHSINAKRNIPTELQKLTPRAREIYTELKTAIVQHKKETH